MLSSPFCISTVMENRLFLKIDIKKIGNIVSKIDYWFDICLKDQTKYSLLGWKRSQVNFIFGGLSG